MFSKLVIITTLVAVAFGGIAQVSYTSPLAYTAHAPITYAAPVAKTVVAESYDPHPQYSFGYGVNDQLTGDSKTQHEERDGDVVHGSYSLIDADGFRRIVEYTADPVNGFNAIVHREPLGATVKVAKVATPISYAAPVHTLYHH